MDWALLISTGIFLTTYGAIISGRVQRSIATMMGAVGMVVTGLFFGFFTQGEVIHQAIGWNTIGLLLGMMLVVGVLEDTGLFEALSVWIAKLSRGNYFYMIVLLGLFTALASTTVDNVTTLLLVAPISLKICLELGVDPKPILLTEAIFSDIGGVATLVGCPSNVMIAGAAGLSYVDFIVNLAPLVIICLFASFISFRLIFADKIKEENSEINLKKKSEEEIFDQSSVEEIKDWDLLQKSLAVLVFIIFLFVIHHTIGLEPATVALVGAALLLFITRPEIEKIVSRVKWTTLLFFAGLFVVVHGVAETGLLNMLAEGLVGLASGNLVLIILAVLFITAFGSAFVDNIPFTAAMIPVVITITSEIDPGSSILWWALAIAAGFGANGTFIGSSANVVAVRISEDYGNPISFWYWFKYGTIIMLITVGIAGIALSAQALTPFHVPLLPG